VVVQDAHRAREAQLERASRHRERVLGIPHGGCPAPS
jgi:hypothetical protein